MTLQANIVSLKVTLAKSPALERLPPAKMPVTSIVKIPALFSSAESTVKVLVEESNVTPVGRDAAPYLIAE